MNLHLDLINPTAPTWPTELAALWQFLGAPHNPELLPDYFVQTTFIKMGGHVLRLRDGDELRGTALLFPRGIEGGRQVYTLRLNETDSRWQELGGKRQETADPIALYHQLATLTKNLLAVHHHGVKLTSEPPIICRLPPVTHLPPPVTCLPPPAFHLPPPTAHLPPPTARFRIPAFGSRQPYIKVHHPKAAHTYKATHRHIGAFSVGTPGADELDTIRAMHMAIWGAAPGAQYPNDLHSAEFGPGTSLVARAGQQLAGFLLGFYRFGGLDGLERAGVDTSLSIESQVMGVDTRLRRAGLAATLKRAQATEALARGINVIHWTADPLQFANATLNFHKLRAVAGEFYPAYYPFQNELNRVPASRLGITWLPNNAWGRAGMVDGPRHERSLNRFPGCVVLNTGPQIIADARGAPHIAIEIPVDWTALQRDDIDTAAAWRTATDSILAEVVGYTPGHYLIADVAVDGDRRYLIGHTFEEVWSSVSERL
ncbi:MAG: hypothetical protein HGA19_09400 [Oscillochloris sp.]|nr:hypothetical protein [Oscillochloris sp.]